MTLVSSKEFAINEDKYFDLAMNEQVFVQRKDSMFIVQNITQKVEPDKIFEPDEDFYRAIPIEEVRDHIVEYIRKKHKNDSNCNTGGH